MSLDSQELVSVALQDCEAPKGVDRALKRKTLFNVHQTHPQDHQNHPQDHHEQGLVLFLPVVLGGP